MPSAIDEVVDITGEVDGDAGNPFNKKWYQLNGEGYTYSGWVQPVETNYQKPEFNIPAGGQLGEITVPYSITRLQPSFWAQQGLSHLLCDDALGHGRERQSV